MKNKTIFDAVNEFKGDWPYEAESMIESKGDLVDLKKGDLTDFYRPDSDCLNLELWSFTCSKKEFNALVEEMKLGLDVNEIPERMLHCYKYNAKELLEPVEPVIDWKDAPDGMSKFGRIGNNGAEVFYNSEGYFYKESGKYFPFDKENECTFDFDKVSLVATRPTQSNTYTQEMADSGVLPSVGMECLINFPDIDDVWYEYTIDFMGNYTFIASCEDVSERFGYVDDVHFKPIKPLTPPVPLINGKAYQFECNGHKDINGIYNDDGYFIDHSANIYVDCTNIQPLTLD